MGCGDVHTDLKLRRALRFGVTRWVSGGLEELPEVEEHFPQCGWNWRAQEGEEEQPEVLKN